MVDRRPRVRAVGADLPLSARAHRDAVGHAASCRGIPFGYTLRDFAGGASGTAADRQEGWLLFFILLPMLILGVFAHGDRRAPDRDRPARSARDARDRVRRRRRARGGVDARTISRAARSSRATARSCSRSSCCSSPAASRRCAIRASWAECSRVAVVLGFVGRRPQRDHPTHAGARRSRRSCASEAKPGDLVVYCPDQVGPVGAPARAARPRRGRVPELRRAGARRLGRLQEAAGGGRSRRVRPAPRLPGPARTRSGTSARRATSRTPASAKGSPTTSPRPAADPAHALRRRRSSRSPRCRCSRPRRRAECALPPVSSRAVVRAVLVPYVISRVIVVGDARDDPPHRHDAAISRSRSRRTPVCSRGTRRGTATSPGRVTAASRRRVLRFFPLFPLLGRAVSWLPGVSAGLRGRARRERVGARVGLRAVPTRHARARRSRPRTPRGVARLSRTARVRARHGLRGSDVHDLRRDRAARSARRSVGGSPRSSASSPG